MTGRAHQLPLEITFGDDVLDEGFTAAPNIFLAQYANLGIKDAQAMWVLQVLKFKWGKEDPYPSQDTLPMRCATPTRRGYARHLREKGLLFTRRMYWQEQDVGKYDLAPDKVGTVRSLRYDFSVLLHNAVRMHRWTQARKRVSDFQVEIPVENVEKVAYGFYNDTPPFIQLLCEKHIVEESGDQPLLLSEKRIVEAKKAIAGGATIGNLENSQPALLSENLLLEKPVGNKTHPDKKTLLLLMERQRRQQISKARRSACCSVLTLRRRRTRASMRLPTRRPSSAGARLCEIRQNTAGSRIPLLSCVHGSTKISLPLSPTARPTRRPAGKAPIARLTKRLCVVTGPTRRSPGDKRPSTCRTRPARRPNGRRRCAGRAGRFHKNAGSGWRFWGACSKRGKVWRRT